MHSETKAGAGLLAAALLSLLLIVLLSIGGVFLNAKLERPLNDIHRQATECSLEYVNSTQATLRAQITQYNGFTVDTTEGQKRALVSQMHAEADVIDSCNSTESPLPPSVRAFLNSHTVN